ncbi:MAG: GAF domain-containing protein [Leptolyngbyaceae cyanobacterium bins.59]|nr:GAF domain-containing protein [Leptolyngbyaceae cyanobacterium bins.59]
MTPEQLAALQEYCRDQAAFEQLKQILTVEEKAPTPTLPSPQPQPLGGEDREQSLLRLMNQLGRSLLNQIRQPSEFDDTLQAALHEVRVWLKADRVTVYRFNLDWSGEFVVESVAPGWMSLIEEQANTPLFRQNISHCGLQRLTSDTYLQSTQGGEFQSQPFCVANDIYQAGFSDCYLEMLQRFQVRAYITVPIFTGDRLWGLLAAYQNAQPRLWERIEINLMMQVGSQMGGAIQISESIQESQLQAEQRRVIANVADKIRRPLDLEVVLTATTEEVRQLLRVDRVAVYRFNPDWSGEFIAESVAPGWQPLVGDDVHQVWADTYLQEHQGGRYRNHGTMTVENIYTAGLFPCHVELLEQFQAQAYAIVPVFVKEQLWGLLAAYQNGGPRFWQLTEVDLLMEIGMQMGIALNQSELVAKLQQEVMERQQAETVIRELNRELERLNQDLAKQNAELEATNQELEAFSYSVSHDLRAPLRSIDGFSQALLEDYPDRLDATGQNYLNRIRNATQRMGELIDDLLNLSRVMRNEMRWEAVDLSLIARSIATELRQSAPTRSVEFKIQDEIIVNGDSRLLRVLLFNLLDNAWKFTSKHPQATIEFGSIEQEGNKLYFVKDDGAGFDMAYINKLFGAFQRLHGVHEFPGTGIGLATVQRIVHRHGGKVWAEGAVDQGAIFYFIL